MAERGTAGGVVQGVEGVEGVEGGGRGGGSKGSKGSSSYGKDDVEVVVEKDAWGYGVVVIKEKKTKSATADGWQSTGLSGWSSSGGSKGAEEDEKAKMENMGLSVKSGKPNTAPAEKGGDGGWRSDNWSGGGGSGKRQRRA